MGMYPLIEDAMNKRFDELVAAGLSEDEAAEVMAEDAGGLDERIRRLEGDMYPGEPPR